MRAAAVAKSKVLSSGQQSSQQLLRSLSANELVFGVVGPVGAGTSEIAQALSRLLEQREYKTTIIKGPRPNY